MSTLTAQKNGGCRIMLKMCVQGNSTTALKRLAKQFIGKLKSNGKYSVLTNSPVCTKHLIFYLHARCLGPQWNFYAMLGGS